MNETRVITNNVPRPILDSCELSQADAAFARREFNWINWSAIDNGEESASFVKYRGELIPFATIERCNLVINGIRWDGARCDSFFSCVIVRFPIDETGHADCESVICGLMLS